MGATILHDLVVVMVIAAAVTILFYRLKQPVVLGYLAAGALIGPHSGKLSLVHDSASIEGLAELGIIFLMFAVGLEFNLQKLRKVGPRAAIAAVLQITLMLGLGYGAGMMLGWTPIESIFLGAIVSISSTTIIVKVLAEMGKLKEDYTELVMGILVIEDLAAILIVSMLSTMGVTGALSGGAVFGALGGILLFLFIFIAVGLVIVPRLIDVVSKFHVEEVLVITVVGLAFGAAMLAWQIGFSLSLGAFLIGAIVAESKAVRRVGDKIAPIRDLFVAVFFVAVGMLLNPVALLANIPAILLITLITIVGKIAGVTAAAFLTGYDGRTSVKAGSTMGQIGEFSFVIAALGLTLGIVRPELHPIAVAVCALTSILTPWTIRMGPVVADALAPRTPRLLVRALAGYTRFLRQARNRGIDPLRRADKERARHGTRVAIYAAWFLGLLIVAAYVSRWLGAEVGEALSLGANASRTAAVGFLGLASLPLFVAFNRATEAWALGGAKLRAMAPDRLSRPEAHHRHPRIVARAFSITASLILVAVAVRIAWGVHPLAIPNSWLLVPVLSLVALIGWVARKRLARFHNNLETTLNELMGEEESASETEQIRERLPWGMDVAELHVSSHSRGAYTSLKNLRLREQTGATLLSIERRGNLIPNPHADVALLPGDRLMLVGKRDQLAQAASYLQTNVPNSFSTPAKTTPPRPAAAPLVVKEKVRPKLAPPRLTGTARRGPAR